MTCFCLQALPILKEAWDRGINTIDTANMYSNGDSERVIRKFIEKARSHAGPLRPTTLTQYAA